MNSISGRTAIMLLISIVLMLLSSCKGSADSRYHSGYGDGYATSYNTTLEIRATLVEGDWDDKHYKRGYDDGYADGVAEAKTEQGK